MNTYEIVYELKSNSARLYKMLVVAASEFDARKAIKKKLKRESFRIRSIEKV